MQRSLIVTQSLSVSCVTLLAKRKELDTKIACDQSSGEAETLNAGRTVYS